MTGIDPFDCDDAAYVLGALDDEDRGAFAAHLTTCGACRDRVADLEHTRAALALLAIDEVRTLDQTPAPPQPDTLLPGLLRRAGASRRRRRFGIATLAAVAAACAAGAIISVWPQATGNPAPRSRAMTALVSTSLTATATVQPTSWGTRITLDCHYAAGTPYPPTTRPYGLTVIGTDGRQYELGSWRVDPGRDTVFATGTALSRGQIRSVQITGSDRTAILTLTL